MKMNLRSVLTGVLLVVLLSGTIFFIKRNRPVPVLAPKPASEASRLLKVHGPETAPVKIVEYSDFECPSCRAVQEDVQRFFKSYPGKIQLTFKHFPLTSHKWSLYAHQAAECMNRQGKFWPYHDKVYDKQKEWAPSIVPPVEILARYARELSADMDQFGKCMADVSVTREIYAEKEEGNLLQVGATPTFFLGGERCVGPKEMQGRGENAIRKILGLPLKPLPVEKKEPPKPVFPSGIPKQKEA
ncbi:MAG: thioredoxin domain-containing protein [Candidatus Omnitrophota bacterium]